MMDELKMCPFCSSESRLLHQLVAAIRDDFWVVCRKCGMQTAHFDSKQEAIAAWNRRAEWRKDAT